MPSPEEEIAPGAVRVVLLLPHLRGHIMMAARKACGSRWTFGNRVVDDVAFG